MKNIKKTSIFAVASFTMCSLSFGQIALYEFGPDGSDSANTANISASDMTVGGAATSFSSNTTFGTDFVDEPYARLNGDWTGLTAAEGGYATFTLTPAAGFELEVTSFDFVVSATGAGPDTIAALIGGVLYDNLQTSFQDTSATIVNVNVNDTFTSATEFRIIGYAGGTGNMDIDTLTVNGSVVPEPSSYALLAGMMGLACVVLRRRAARA